MIKMICDFCQNDVKELISIKVPVFNKVSAYNSSGIKVLEYEDGNIVPEAKDICRPCASKLIKAIALMREMNDD